MADNRPTFFQWLAGYREEPLTAFRKYQAAGGGLSYNQWLNQGKPSATTLTPRTQQILQQQPEQIAWLKEQQKFGAAGLMPSPQEQAQKAIETTKAGAEYGMIQQAEASAFPTTPPPAGYHYVWSSSGGVGLGGYVLEPIPPRAPPSERQPYAPYGVNPYDNPETPQQEGQFNPHTGQWEAPSGYITPQQQWEREQTSASADLQRQQMFAQQQYQAQQMGLQQQQLAWQQQEAEMQRAQQEKAYRAQLSAQPRSWLEYASYTGQEPVTQPWMLPLQAGQYGSQAGQPIPGWTAGTGRGMSALLNPSAQYWSRMGPTGQQQYLGYEQARTGAIPEETAFRLASSTPPGGRNVGLSWVR